MFPSHDPVSLEIESENLLPSRYWISQDPKLDKRQIMADLKDGVEVEGARMGDKGITLQIRRG